MGKTIQVFKVHGHKKEKIKLFLSFFLIFPIFRWKKHIFYIQDNLEVMSSIRNNIYEAIKLRQKKVKLFYSKYSEHLKDNQKGVCEVIIKDEATYNNMIAIELEIEGLMNLVYSNKKETHINLFQIIREELSSSELEVNNLYQAYTQFFSNIIKNNKKFPWKLILKCIDLSSKELTIMRNEQ